MRVAIYTPYLDTAGGGEKYILTIAELFLSRHDSVDILLDSNLSNMDFKRIVQSYTRLHNLDLTGVKMIKAPIGQGSSFWQRYIFLRQYDLLFYNSDGSIFYSSAKRSVLHFQLPLELIQYDGLWNKFKLGSWQKVIYNSYFTAGYYKLRFNLGGEIIYPPVDTSRFKRKKKRQQLLTVGRLAGEGIKKQDIMIKAFSELLEKKILIDWRFYIVGSLGKGDEQFFGQLKLLSTGLPIEILPNVSYQKLTSLYEESMIYWHATGFAEDDPKNFEHFGITTVEAMAARCVPVVINKGGQSEIVENESSGFLWNNLEELKQQTAKLALNNQLFEKMSDKAQNRANLFSEKRFKEKISKLV